MPEIFVNRPHQDDNDAKKVTINYEYNKLLSRNLCWAAVHTLCLAGAIFGYVVYPICPYDQAPALGFIIIGALSFFTFWTYIFVILCDTLLFNDGITVNADVFIEKLKHCNSLWFMMACTQLILMLIILIAMTVMTAPFFQSVNDIDDKIFEVATCDAYNRCCDEVGYLVGQILVIILWVVYLVIVILIIVYYLVPAIKDCKQNGCCGKNKDDDDDDEGGGDETQYSETKAPTTKKPSTSVPAAPTTKPSETPTAPTTTQKSTKPPTESSDGKTPTTDEPSGEPTETDPGGGGKTVPSNDDPSKPPSGGKDDPGNDEPGKSPGGGKTDPGDKTEPADDEPTEDPPGKGKTPPGGNKSNPNDQYSSDFDDQPSETENIKKQ